MQDYRRLILVFFGIAMIAVAWFWQSQQRPEPLNTIEPTVQPKQNTYILVAARNLDTGTIVNDELAEWALADDRQLPSGAMIRREGQDEPNPYLGRLIVKSAVKGEALLPLHFSAADSTNYVAQLLQPGKRAYAIAIDSKGTATAGNFILPNDRVDIIRSFNSTNGLQSETILSNIRVLAIGQSVHGEGLSSIGETATVEVDLYEAELLATAQRSGQISLALRNSNEAGSTRSAPLLIIRPAPAAEKVP